LGREGLRPRALSSGAAGDRNKTVSAAALSHLATPASHRTSASVLGTQLLTRVTAMSCRFSLPSIMRFSKSRPKTSAFFKAQSTHSCARPRARASNSADPMKRRALFFDRDGVVNVDTGYLHRIEDCAFIESIFEMVEVFHERGLTIIVAPNQAGTGRGYYGEAEFKLLMDWMRDRFEGKIAAVYHCPDHPEGIGVYRRKNPWRKPGSGMLLKAAQEFDLDLTRSWMVGDKETDVEAAARVGIGHIVRLDPTAPTMLRINDYWLVPYLAQ
jgi:D-glycero-D-manno-heptose 1,7-bisphosphate phosphatase